MATDWFPLWLSLRVAGLSTLISLLLALWLAWLFNARVFRGKHLLDAIITLPLVLPPTVLGYYLLVLLGRRSPLGQLYEWCFGQPLVFTWQAAVVAALLHSAPLLIKFSTAALESVPRRYPKAARSLGASEWRVFWHVTLPLAWNQILAATALAFARALGDFGITIMVAGNIPGVTQTLPLAVYSRIQHPGGIAGSWRLVALSILLACLALAAGEWLEHRERHRHA